MFASRTIFRWAAKEAIETLLSRPNPLLAAILSKNQVEPITEADLHEWWIPLQEMGYRPNTLEAAAFIIGVRHGRHNDLFAPEFVRWTDAQMKAGEAGWIYGRSRIGNPVLYPVMQFTPDPRLQLV
jgi:hypothetical protein